MPLQQTSSSIVVIETIEPTIVEPRPVPIFVKPNERTRRSRRRRVPQPRPKQCICLRCEKSTRVIMTIAILVTAIFVAGFVVLCFY
ncbi:unnamed protein product [Caenorhabditis brenneri]